MATPVRPKGPTAPTRHIYDVIVLGAQVGGALAAALLAKRGYRVLFVEHDGMGPGYEHDGFLLPYGPSVVPSLRTMPEVDAVLGELGLTTAVQRALRAHTPELQLVLPRHRADLHADPARRRAELVREWGEALGGPLADALARAAGAAEASNPFFASGPELSPEGFLGAWSARRVVGQHPGLEAEPPLTGDDEVSRLVQGLLPFLVHLDAPGSALARARPLAQALSAPQRFPGGREGLRELLCKRLSELGGELLTRETTDSFIAESVQFDGGRFSGVKLLRNDTLYRANCLVAATDAGALRRLITEKRSQRALAEQLELSQTRRFLFAVNWVLPPAALPRGMGELVLVDTQDPEVGTLLVQQHAARSVDGKDDPGHVVVSAGAFLPASARDLGEEHLAALAQRVDGHLERLMPFAVRHRVLRSAPYLDASGVRGSRLMPHPLYAFEAESFLGITGLRQRTPVKNLLLAGREVLPGLGLEGELLAGLRAARLVGELFKKKELL